MMPVSEVISWREESRGGGLQALSGGAGNELALLPGAGYAVGCTSENWAGCTHREPYSVSARQTENVNEQMERMLYLAKFYNKYYIGDQAQNIG